MELSEILNNQVDPTVPKTTMATEALLSIISEIRKLEADNETLLDALEHCGYDPEDCIDCGGPPHDEHCRFWKLKHLLSYWEAHDAK